jgi:hypothetical protein
VNGYGLRFSRTGEVVQITRGDDTVRLPGPIRAVLRTIGAVFDRVLPVGAAPTLGVTHVLDLGEHHVGCHLDDWGVAVLESGYPNRLTRSSWLEPVVAPGGDPMLVLRRGERGEPCGPVGVVVEVRGSRVGIERDTADHVLDRVLPLMTRVVLDLESDRLHLHAGAAVVGGRAVVVLGPSGAGKSTLVAHLAADAAVLNDEIVGVAVGRDGPVATGAARPLALRDGGAGGVAGLAGRTTDRTVGRVLSPLAIGARHVASAPIALVVVLDRRADHADPVLHEVSVLDAVEHLLLNSLDLPTGPVAHLRTVTRVVASVPTLRLGYAEAATVRSMLAARLGAVPEEVPADVRVGTLDAETGVPAVITVVDGDRALLFLPPSRRIVRLDVTATADWLGLGAGTDAASVDALLAGLAALPPR